MNELRLLTVHAHPDDESAAVLEPGLSFIR